MTPLTVSKTSTNKDFDVVRVLAGADPVTGKLIDGESSSFGAQMRRLAKGVWMLVHM